MRNFTLIATGLAVLLVIATLCLKSGQADADDSAADTPHDFAHYALNALHVGDPARIAERQRWRVLHHLGTQRTI